jgi:hypothetical protein
MAEIAAAAAFINAAHGENAATWQYSGTVPVVETMASRSRKHVQRLRLST